MIRTSAPRHRARRPACPAVCVLVLAACTNAPPETGPAAGYAFTALEAARIPAPANAPAGTCWARDVTPAVVETQTAQVEVRPALRDPDGSVLAPAVFATETEQMIVKPRQSHVFETLCADRITPDFVASLQRALQARDRYDGAITGEIDAATEIALRLYQRDQGLETGLLTMTTARALGLVAVERN